MLILFSVVYKTQEKVHKTACLQVLLLLCIHFMVHSTSWRNVPCFATARGFCTSGAGVGGRRDVHCHRQQQHMGKGVRVRKSPECLGQGRP